MQILSTKILDNAIIYKIYSLTEMNITQPLAFPDGFEQLSKERQIDYVQQLWDVILSISEEVPVPGWHLEVVQQRFSSQDTANLISWNEVKQRLLSKYREF